MTLDDFFNGHPNFRRAKNEDNLAILNFFNSITMDTNTLSLRYDRGVDFFNFSREQSNRNYNFVIEDDDNKIKGTGTIALIDHLYNGKKETFAYLGDLRISPTLNAKIRIRWKKCYSDLIKCFKEIDEFKSVAFLYTAILEDNQAAMRSLLKNNDDLIYHELSSYNAYNIYLKKPFSPISNAYYVKKISRKEYKEFVIKDKDIGLMNYIDHENYDELDRRLDTWNNVSEDEILAVFNSKNEIVLATIPWICKSKKLIIEKMSPIMTMLTKLLPLLKIPSFHVGSPVNVLYLTHLHFNFKSSSDDRTQALNTVLAYLFKLKRKSFHTLSFFVFPSDHLQELAFVGEITKGRFYQVMNKSDFNSQNYIDLNNTTPAFEIGIA